MEELKKLEEHKAQLHADIERYGKDLESIGKQISDFRDMEIDSEGLKEEIKALKIEKNDLIASQQEYETIEAKKLEIFRDIETAKGIIAGMAAKTQEATELHGHVETLKAQIGSHEIVKLQHEKDIQMHSITIADADVKIADLEAYYSVREQELIQRLKNKEMVAQEEIALIDKAITEHKKEYETVLASIEEKENQLLFLQADHIELQSTHSNLEKAHHEKKTTLENELIEMRKAADTRSAELDQREGDLSIKESSFAQKRNHLIATKTRIEKETGKSITIDL